MSDIFSLSVVDASELAVDDVLTGSKSAATAVITKIVDNLVYINMTSTNKYFICETKREDSETLTNQLAETTTMYTALGLISLLTEEILRETDDSLTDWLSKNESDYMHKIESSFSQLKTDLLTWAVDWRLIRMKDSKEPKFTNCHLYKCLELIYFQLANDTDDIYWAKYLVYQQKYINAITGIYYDYDEDDSGTISDDEKNSQISNTRWVR